MFGDAATRLMDQIRSAAADKQRLLIQGHSSKRSWMAPARGDDVLDLTAHQGILQYQPEELVLTARAGTPIIEIEQTLAAQRQMLASEPPCLAGNPARSGTLGGAVASGLSGPGRPWLGAVRDGVLGVELINGKGEYLRFGGQVMKNVAGYDVSRLQAGAWGCLGVMSVISMRVQPWPETQCTLSAAMTAQAATALCAELGRRNLPITGSCWYLGVLYLRLAGNDSGVAAGIAALAAMGLARTEAVPSLWQQLKNHEHRFFYRNENPHGDAGEGENRSGDADATRGSTLWRVITPPAAPQPEFLANPDQDLLMLWGGGLRWLYHHDAQAVKHYSQQVGGWCWALGDSIPVDPVSRRIMDQLGLAFDPDGVFAHPLDLGSTATPAQGGRG